MQPTGSDAVPPSTSTYYSSQLASSVDHSNSHAGFAQPRSSFHRPGSTVGEPTSAVVSGDRYLKAAEGIQLTQEEKQEGYYDPSLLQSRPRNTAAPPPSDPQTQQTRSNTPSVPASSLPYASRTRDDPTGAKLSTSTKLPPEGRQREGGGIEKEGVGRYPSRPSKGPHHQSRSRVGDNNQRRNEKNGPSSRRRKRKQLSWWQKPRTFIALIIVIIVVGVAVGLGVGLTSGKKGSERSPGNPEVSTNSDQQVTKDGIQPSVSAASTVDSSITARPSVSVAARSRVFRRIYVD